MWEAQVSDLEVVLATNERVTLRVGETYLKVDADQARADVEVAAMDLASVPTPEILWRRHPVLALAALPGRALGRLGQPSTASPAAWAAAGTEVRRLHEAPLPPWPGTSIDELSRQLTDECDWLVGSGVVSVDVVSRNRRRAEAVLRRWAPVFIHGDLRVEHVFVDGDSVTGIIDWSEARPGDALFDLATLTLGQEAHLEDVIAGYGGDVDRHLVRAWWSWRCLTVIRWLWENGFGPPEHYPEVSVLRSLD